MKRAHIERLSKMQRAWKAHEDRLQAIYGDPSPGSIRASEKLDLEALTAALDALAADGVPAAHQTSCSNSSSTSPDGVNLPDGGSHAS